MNQKQNCPYVHHEGIWEKKDIIKGRYSDFLHAGRTVDRNPVTGEIFSTHSDLLWNPPSLLYNAYRYRGRGTDPLPPF